MLRRLATAPVFGALTCHFTPQFGHLDRLDSGEPELWCYSNTRRKELQHVIFEVPVTALAIEHVYMSNGLVTYTSIWLVVLVLPGGGRGAKVVEGSMNGDSTVARRQLSRELRKLRLEAGISAEMAADELGISLSTLSRLENGKSNISVGNAKTMCNLYDRPDLAAAFADLARASKTRSWWRQYSDVIPEWFDVYIGLEQAAASFRWYEVQLVPGILQTEAYTRTVIRTDHPDDAEEDVDRRVQLRMKRQALLTKSDPANWHIVLDEAILHRPVGGATVMLDQLNRLLEVAALPNVKLGVVPFKAGMYAGVTSSSFVVMDFPAIGSRSRSTEPTTVYVEGFTGSLYTDEKDEVDRYRTAFDGIQRAALNPSDTKTAIARALKEMKKR